MTSTAILKQFLLVADLVLGYHAFDSNQGKDCVLVFFGTNACWEEAVQVREVLGRPHEPEPEIYTNEVQYIKEQIKQEQEQKQEEEQRKKSLVGQLAEKEQKLIDVSRENLLDNAFPLDFRNAELYDFKDLDSKDVFNGKDWNSKFVKNDYKVPRPGNPDLAKQRHLNTAVLKRLERDILQESFESSLGMKEKSLRDTLEAEFEKRIFENSSDKDKDGLEKDKKSLSPPKILKLLQTFLKKGTTKMVLFSHNNPQWSTRSSYCRRIIDCYSFEPQSGLSDMNIAFANEAGCKFFKNVLWVKDSGVSKSDSNHSNISSYSNTNSKGGTPISIMKSNKEKTRNKKFNKKKTRSPNHRPGLRSTSPEDRQNVPSIATEDEKSSTAEQDDQIASSPPIPSEDEKAIFEMTKLLLKKKLIPKVQRLLDEDMQLIDQFLENPIGKGESHVQIQRRESQRKEKTEHPSTLVKSSNTESRSRTYVPMYDGRLRQWVNANGEEYDWSVYRKYVKIYYRDCILLYLKEGLLVKEKRLKEEQEGLLVKEEQVGLKEKDLIILSSDFVTNLLESRMLVISDLFKDFDLEVKRWVEDLTDAEDLMEAKSSSGGISTVEGARIPMGVPLLSFSRSFSMISENREIYPHGQKTGFGQYKKDKDVLTEEGITSKDSTKQEATVNKSGMDEITTSESHTAKKAALAKEGAVLMLSQTKAEDFYKQNILKWINHERTKFHTPIPSIDVIPFIQRFLPDKDILEFIYNALFNRVMMRRLVERTITEFNSSFLLSVSSSDFFVNYLKIDIEGAEYRIMRRMIKESVICPYFNYLAVDSHWHMASNLESKKPVDAVLPWIVRDCGVRIGGGAIGIGGGNSFQKHESFKNPNGVFLLMGEDVDTLGRPENKNKILPEVHEDHWSNPWWRGNYTGE